MRTEPLSPLASAVDRLRGQTRRLAARAGLPPARWPFVALAVGIAVVAAVAYGISAVPSRSGAFVRSGESFSDDDLKVIARALEAKQLPARPDDDGRVEVAASRLDEANAIVAKLHVGPKGLADIDRERAEGASLWETYEDRQERAERARNEELAALIRPLGGIVSAWVKVTRPKGRPGQRVAGASAFVMVKTRGNAPLAHTVVKSIQDVIVGADPEIKPGLITILDRTGKSYLDATDPSLGVLNRKRAREEEFRDGIADKLGWLKGVQVSVQLAAPPVTETTPKPAAPAPKPAASIMPPEPPSMSMNRPLSAAPEAPKSVNDPTPTPLAATPEANDETVHGRARVWVTVPRSYYYKLASAHEPTAEELQAFVARTESNVKMAVSIAVPPDWLGDVSVSTIADELPPTSPPPPSTADIRAPLSWWVPVGVATAAVIVSLLLTIRVVATRRPALRSGGFDLEGDRGRYKIDEAPAPGSGPGPSERVRELIRQNPEAAASVLHRWTGQGGVTG